MLSDSIKYKDLRSEKHTYKSAIGSKRIENPYIIFRQIFRCAQQHVQISRHISLVATYLSARNIRICDPKNTPINQKIGSKRIENPYIIFRQIFRCAQQHVQISRNISLVATYPSARGAAVSV